MPSSSKKGKEEIKAWFQGKDIKTILDIGAGQATYPKLLGDTYEYTGVEIFNKYVSMWELKKYYKKIIIGDASKIELPEADCIIFGDVLEHMEKETALKLLKDSLKKYKHIVVSIPLSDKEPYEGAEHYGNHHEKHVSYWKFDEVKNMHTWEIARNIHEIGVFCV